LKRLQNAIHVAAGALLFAGSFGLVSSVGFAQTQSTKSPAAKSASPSAKAPASSTTHNSTTGHTSKTSSKKKSTSSKSSRVKMQTAPTPDRIRDIQSALAKAGAYDGEPTGKWDDHTVAAMTKFQQTNGLNPTGKLDALSLQKLGLGSDTAGKGAPRPAATPTATASTTPGNHR
jgi:peptidoglycan hydrolase-like protein with peptidoglycan-binding domain